MNKETQNKCISEARIYIKDRFDNMTNEEYQNLCYGDGLLSVVDEAIEQFNVEFEDVVQVFNYCSKPKFEFHKFRLNVEQLQLTTNQLHETISQFGHERDVQYFNNDEEYRNHIVGKLKFFIDMYANAYSDEDVNQNYYAFMHQLCRDYSYDDLLDVRNTYFDFITNLIDSLFEIFERDGWVDIDEVHGHLDSMDNINFQEQQFIMDCYVSKCRSYKIIRWIDDKLCDEQDYYYCLKEAAINAYCREFKCSRSDIMIQEIE